MAKKSNKKPGQNKSQNKNLMMKRKSRNLNQSKFAKIILLLMVLAFIIPGILQLLSYLF